MILYSLSVIGLTNIIVDSSIFEPIRNYFRNTVLGKIMTCKQCCGFWSGILCGLIFISSNPLEVLGCGFAGSFLSVLADKVLELINSFNDLLQKRIFNG